MSNQIDNRFFVKCQYYKILFRLKNSKKIYEYINN